MKIKFIKDKSKVKTCFPLIHQEYKEFHKDVDYPLVRLGEDEHWFLFTDHFGLFVKEEGGEETILGCARLSISLTSNPYPTTYPKRPLFWKVAQLDGFRIFEKGKGHGKLIIEWMKQLPSIKEIRGRTAQEESKVFWTKRGASFYGDGRFHIPIRVLSEEEEAYYEKRWLPVSKEGTYHLVLSTGVIENEIFLKVGEKEKTKMYLLPPALYPWYEEMEALKMNEGKNVFPSKVLFQLPQ